MNFTSINKLTGSPIRAFRGLIRPEFNEWIGSRWRSGTGLFSAVRLSFQRSADPFGQISWPQSSASRSEFLFAPTIQLTFNSFPVTNMFRESHTRNLKTSHRSVGGPVFDVRNFLKSSRGSNTFHFQSSFFSTPAPVFLARQYWPTVFAIKGQMHSPGSRVERSTHSTTALHTTTQRQATEKFFEQLTGILSSRSEMISSSVRHWTQLISNLVHDTAVTQESSQLLRTTVGAALCGRPLLKTGAIRKNGRPRRAAPTVDVAEAKPHRETRHHVHEQLLNVRDGISRNIFQSFATAALSFRSWVNIRTVDEATHSRQSFLRQLSNQFWLRQSLQERSFSSVVQKFAVSKSSSAESFTRQVQYFGQPPDLTYAKSESPQLQQLVTALRDFRPAQQEIKAPAPQLPSIAQITTQVRQQLERELRIERERRGL